MLDYSRELNEAQKMRSSALICLFVVLGFVVIYFFPQIGWKEVFFANEVVAKFQNPVEIDTAEWSAGQVMAICKIDSHSSREIHLIGAQVSCPCISTDDLPVQLNSGESCEIAFTIALAGFPETERGKRITYDVSFISSDGLEPIKGELVPYATTDLKGGIAAEVTLVD